MTLPLFCDSTRGQQAQAWWWHLVEAFAQNHRVYHGVIRNIWTFIGQLLPLAIVKKIPAKNSFANSSIGKWWKDLSLYTSVKFIRTPLTHPKTGVIYFISSFRLCMPIYEAPYPAITTQSRETLPRRTGRPWASTYMVHFIIWNWNSLLYKFPSHAWFTENLNYMLCVNSV